MRKFLRISLAGLSVILLVAIALILWPQRAAPLPEPENSRIIHNVRVIDVHQGTASEPVSVVIRDGVIAAIGPELKTSGRPALDASGAFLVPGFWDMHVHTFQSSPQMHLPLWVAGGVTNVRDMMDCPGEEDSLIACSADKRRWNAETERGRLAAPRIVEMASYHLEGADITAAEASHRVQRYHARGLDAVKVYNRLDPKAYSAAARQARALGMRLVGHLPLSIALEEAIAAGQVSFEHAHLLARHCFGRAAAWRAGKLAEVPPAALLEEIVATHDAVRCEAAATALAEAGAWYVPTHVTREEDARAHDPQFASDPRLDYLDPLSRFAWEDDQESTRTRYAGPLGEKALTDYFGHGLTLTGMAHDRGVGVLVGTDTIVGGLRYHDELEHLVRAGLSPAEVLRAATLDAARYARMDATSGSIEVGKRADLVLLDANPLDDIGNTRQIRAVIHHGRLYDRKRLDELLAFVRAEAAAPHNWVKLLWGFARSSVVSDL